MTEKGRPVGKFEALPGVKGGIYPAAIHQGEESGNSSIKILEKMVCIVDKRKEG